jgi:glycosyltransferase involved in cell wall biosynthesis
MSPSVLQLLPHPGGGGELNADALRTLEGYEQSRVYLTTARRGLKAWLSLPAGWIRAARAASSCDLLYVTGDMAAVLTIPLLRTRPSVVRTAGLHLLRRASGPLAPLARSAIRAVVRSASYTICSSPAEREELTTVVGARFAGRLALVPNGVPVPQPPSREERAAARADLCLDDADVVALFLGALEDHKDPLTAARAVRKARDRGAPLVFLVAGEGSLARVIGEQGGGGVRLLGFRTDTHRLLTASDVYIHPAVREAVSLAILEGMAHGLAVVVSDGAGNPDAVGDAGVVFPLGDDDVLADVLVGLAADPDERIRLGRAARERVLAEGFTRDRWLADMRRVFDAALAGRHG